jgi:hypothetical protein
VTNNIRLTDSTKNRSTLALPLNDTAIETLNALKEKSGDSQYVFPHFEGQLAGEAIRDIKNGWKTAVKRAGITNFRWHDPPPLLCELACHERRRLGSGAKATGTPEHSNDAKVCPPESSVFEPAGESTRQKVAGKWPFRRITKRHNAASGGQVIVLEKLHKDEAQRAQLGTVQTQLEDPMTLKVRAPKSLNFQRREKLDKMFPENCPSDASQSGNMRQLETSYWRSRNRADARLASNYSQ